MHRNVEKVQAILEELGARGRAIEFDVSARTSQEAAYAIGTTLAQICKSMIFAAASGAGVVVLTSGANRVDGPKVAAIVGEPVDRADAVFVRDATGFPIGGVPPVGHAKPMRFLFDKDLLAFDEIWASAGTPHAVFPTTPDEIIRITDAEIADIRVD